MLQLIRTNSCHEAFILLVKELDAYLRIKDGSDHPFYHQYNRLDDIRQVVIAFSGDQPVGCGAIRAYDTDSMEIKRMYVDPSFRGRKLGKLILQELESWARELGFTCCMLETGREQPEAIALYLKAGYQEMENYGPYRGMPKSICFRKSLY
jgi:putative acetyltransferase